VLGRERGRLAVALGLGALLPALLALGANLPLYEQLWRNLPGLRDTRVPERLLPVACLCLAGLAAFALARLPSSAALAALALVAVDLRAGVELFHPTATDPGNRAYAARPHDVPLLELPIFLPDRQEGSVYQYYAIGAPGPREERADCGFVYYGRHFRSDDGQLPAVFGPLLQPYDGMSILTLPCDRGTWGVGLVASGRDPALRALVDRDVWDAVLGAFPLAAHWGQGEPITDVQVMAKIEDRQRHLVIDGRPVATGVVAVGDAWACTNPSVGRGITIGLLHAVALRDLLREVPTADEIGVVRGWHELTMERVAPLVEDTLAFDRHRLAQIDAQIAGHSYETDDPAWALGLALAASASRDRNQFRHYLDVVSLNARGVDVLARPGVIDKTLELGAPAPLPGPSRAEVLELVATATYAPHHE